MSCITLKRLAIHLVEKTYNTFKSGVSRGLLRGSHRLGGEVGLIAATGSSSRFFFITIHTPSAPFADRATFELSLFEFLDRLTDLVPPPRKHRHR